MNAGMNASSGVFVDGVGSLRIVLERRASSSSAASGRPSVVRRNRLTKRSISSSCARVGRLNEEGGRGGPSRGRTQTIMTSEMTTRRRVSTAGTTVFRRGARVATASANASGAQPPPLPPQADSNAMDLRQRLSVFAVMLAVFLHLLGFTVTGPITPGLVSHFNIPSANVGYLTSAYPLGMFGALFLWPQLSDRVGRKPILVLSLMGVGAGLVLQGLCVRSGWSLQAFLALRVLSGAFAGASPVVKAYLADASTPESLPQLMAWREASCTFAFIVGPTLGGLLFAGYSLHAAISVTGWASIAAAGLVLAFMSAPEAMKATSEDGTQKNRTAETEGDTGEQGGNEPPTVSKISPPGVYDPDALSCPLGRNYLTAVATICTTSFLYNAGQSTFDSFFPLLLSKKLAMNPTQIGGLLTALSAVSFTVSATLFAPTQKVLGLTKTTVMGLSLVAIGLVAIGQAGAGLVPPSAFVYVAGLPLFTPAIPILLMQCVPPTRRGTVMGVDSAINSMARIISPIVFGRLFASDPAIAFTVAGLVVACAAVLVLARRWLVIKAPAFRV